MIKLFLLLLLFRTPCFAKVLDICEFLKDESFHTSHFTEFLTHFKNNEEDIISYKTMLNCGFDVLKSAAHSSYDSIEWREFISNISYHHDVESENKLLDDDNKAYLQHILSQYAGPIEKGKYLKKAMQLKDQNINTYKNYIQWAEQRDYYFEAKSILEKAMDKFPNDYGLKLFNASLCPPHFKNISHPIQLEKEIITNLYHFILERLDDKKIKKQNNFSEYNSTSSITSPLYAVGQLPLAWPYLGVGNLKILYECLSFSSRLLSPQLSQYVASHLISIKQDILNNKKLLLLNKNIEKIKEEEDNNDEGYSKITKNILKLGVVGESHGNTSPGQLIGGILSQLPRDAFHVVWFEVSSLETDFGSLMRKRANQVVTLHQQSLNHECPVAKARNQISETQVDVLLYIAIGLTPLTFLLAQSRLAAVQVVFGHGHPITTGARDSIDYFVSSSLFEPLDHQNRQDDVNQQVMFVDDYHSCLGMPIDRHISLVETTEASYSEQLVLFDSLSSSYQPNPPFPRFSRRELEKVLELKGLFSKQRNVFSGYESLNVHMKYKIQVQDTQEMQNEVKLVGYSEQEVQQEVQQEQDQNSPDEYHLYAMLQHSKKIHPRMDAVFQYILQHDNRALILFLEGSRTHFQRWKGLIQNQFHLLRIRFIPRLQHTALLSILSICDVFLDPFPWGAGITSLESFLENIPVVTVPSEIKVLQLALGQYRIMELQSNFLVAENISHYGQLAVRLGQDQIFRTYVKQQIKQQKPRLLNPSISNHGEFDSLNDWIKFLTLVKRSSFYQ